MTAIACLRILFTADGESQPGDIPKHKAQGVADAFLKARWRKPRKCGAVAPLAFVIADHNVEHLDPTEVQGLAAELEKVLFPGRPIGQIALMTFEGDEQAVLKFSALTQKELRGLMNGEGYEGDPGRVHVITADSIEGPLPSTREEAKVAAAEKTAEKKPGLAAATTVVKEPSAKAAAPIGAGFTLVALITGSLWGKPMWGTWWVWDARLTSVFVLFLMYLGLIALNRAMDDPTRAAKASAVLILVGFVNIPIIKFSVEWWNTLHQPASVIRMDGPTIDPEFLRPLIVMAIAFTLLFFTLHILAMRNEILRRRIAVLRRHAARSAGEAA